MDKEQKPYDFINDYRELPVKKRVSLIMIAKKLLLQQKEYNALLADSTAFSFSLEDKKITRDDNR